MQMNQILAYVRRQMREGHSDLMAVDMAVNKFGLDSNQTLALCNALYA